MPGPAPKLDPARRHARVGPRRLPAEGRKGEPPEWPLPPAEGLAQGTQEAVIWVQLWATPQAVEWEQLGWVRVVARYCRTLVGAELLNKDCMSEARQLEDRLGLTPKAMRMLMWEVAVDEVAERRAEPKSVRSRLKAVG